jgi:hypothetical protein
MLHIEKNKNNNAGLFPGSIFLSIGKNSKIAEHVAQFEAVANDKIFG